MTKTLAILAGGTAMAFVGGLFLYTQIMEPANRLEACLGGAVAGGDIGGPFELVSETGETVTDADVITKPTLVYFGYTFCPDVCPLDAARMADVMSILEEEQGQEVGGLFISIDPERDTPEYLATFTDNLHPRMVGLTGSQAQVKAASKAYRTYYARQGDDPEYYLMDHSTHTYLMDPEAGFLTFFRRDLPPTEMAEQVACFAEFA
ncbi:MAG: SCO family protein [Shimia sp.]